MTKKIIEPFLYNNKLKFNEIEKMTNLRSNSLAYSLKNLQKEKVIIKEKEGYSLSEEFEHTVPYISDKQAVLPTLLITIGKGKNFFLRIRKKKPYLGLLGLPAGRLVVGESVAEAVSRIMKIKYGVNAKLKHINSISLEHLKKEGKTVHSFLQIFVTASTRDKLLLTDIEKNRKRIIKSDYQFLKNHLNLRTQIKTINSKV